MTGIWQDERQTEDRRWIYDRWMTLTYLGRVGGTTSHGIHVPPVCQPSGHCFGNWFKSLQSPRASTAHFLSRCQRRASTAHFLSRGEGVPVRPDSASSNGSVNLLFFSGGFFSYFRQSSWPWVTRITCRLHSFRCQIIYGGDLDALYTCRKLYSSWTLLIYSPHFNHLTSFCFPASISWHTQLSYW